MSHQSALVSAGFGRECYPRHGGFARHRHDAGYIALVLGGGYLEAGDHGRRSVEAGDILVHGAFESHFNLIAAQGADVLNLPLPRGVALAPSSRFANPDLLARLAEKSLEEALEALLEAAVAGPPALADWPDLLAAACRNDASLRIGDWARRHGLAPATVSRGFAKAYGVSPARYRVEARARGAWASIVDSHEPLADIALATGFADQAHMTRGVAALTGRPPTRWRGKGQNRSRQG